MPAAPKWALLDYTITETGCSLVINATTDVPVHLWLYYTTVEPVKHTETRVSRGLIVPDRFRFCFVSFIGLEQTEPGDTNFHTWTITDWPFGQKRWFTFRGQIGSIWSPSTGPILNYTSIEMPLCLVYFFTESWTSGPLIPNFVEHCFEQFTGNVLSQEWTLLLEENWNW